MERIELPAALGRALGGDLIADADFPPFDRSRRDGFAVRAEGTSGTNPDAPLPLPVVATISAGHPGAALPPGAAIRIMTGAPIPDGASAVVPAEAVEAAPNWVILKAPAAAGAHIEPLGAEYRRGQSLLPAGTLLGPHQLALLAALGRTEAAVRRRPVVAVLACGDELAAGGAPAGPGQIRNSNAIMIAAAVRSAGGIPITLPAAPDDAGDIATAVTAALTTADAVITTGGAGGGDYDCLGAAMEQTGAQVLFRRLSIRPGTGTTAAIAGGKPWFGLSGSPGAAAVALELLVRPGLHRLAGRSGGEHLLVTASLMEAVSANTPEEHWFWVSLRRRENGFLAERCPPGLAGLSVANGLARVPGGYRLEAGATIAVMITGEVSKDDSGCIDCQ